MSEGDELPTRAARQFGTAKCADELRRAVRQAQPWPALLQPSPQTAGRRAACRNGFIAFFHFQFRHTMSASLTVWLPQSTSGHPDRIIMAAIGLALRPAYCSGSLRG